MNYQSAVIRRLDKLETKIDMLLKLVGGEHYEKKKEDQAQDPKEEAVDTIAPACRPDLVPRDDEN